MVVTLCLLCIYAICWLQWFNLSKSLCNLIVKSTTIISFLSCGHFRSFSSSTPLLVLNFCWSHMNAKWLLFTSSCSTFLYGILCVVLTKELTPKKFSMFQSWDATSISLSAACDLFMRFVTRTSHLEHEKFDAAKSRLIERGEKFGEISLKVI